MTRERKEWLERSCLVRRKTVVSANLTRYRFQTGVGIDSFPVLRGPIGWKLDTVDLGVDNPQCQWTFAGD